MNKQNKLAAQQERAAKRAKAEKKTKAAYIFKFWAPIVIVIVVAVVLVWAVITSGDTSSSSSDDTDVITTESTESSTVTETSDTEEASETETESATLNTDTSLVAESGQTVNIDFTGYIDGEVFDGGSTDGAGYDLELGSGSFIDGFEDGIVGHNVGDSFTLDLQFPDDYWSSDYAGKDVTFEVTLNGIYE